jgi:uncharacterized protein (TIGR00730 family)
MASLDSLCVFCGSSTGREPIHRQAAASLGRLFVEQHIELVYGGGNVGLMGEIAQAIMQAGGEVVGVIPQALLSREKGKRDITRLEVVLTMHERKARMAELSDGFIALPGGYGTLEEFCEILTWAQLGIHAKPIGLLNVGGFYDPLLGFFEHATDAGFVRPEHRQLVIVRSEPAALLEAMRDYHAPRVPQWETAGATKMGT